MKKTIKKSKLAKKKGQSTVEYLLLAGVLVAMIAIFGDTIRGKIGEFTGNMFGKFEQKGSEFIDEK